MALPRRWLNDFLRQEYWLYIIIYVCIHTIDTSGRYKIRRYKKMHFTFSWTRSLIKPLLSLQRPNIIFQPQVAATSSRHKWLCVNVPLLCPCYAICHHIVQQNPSRFGGSALEPIKETNDFFSKSSSLTAFLRLIFYTTLPPP